MKTSQYFTNPFMRIAFFLIISSFSLLLINAISLSFAIPLAGLWGSLIIFENRRWIERGYIYIASILIVGTLLSLLLYILESTFCGVDFWAKFPEMQKSVAYCDHEVVQTRVLVEILVFLAPTGFGISIYIFKIIRQMITRMR